MAINPALTAALAGVFITLQTLIIGAAARNMHPLVTATWVHVGGLIFGITAVLVLRLPFAVDVVRAQPWILLAGVFGVGIVTTIGAALAGGLSLGTTLAIVTGAQLLLAFTLDAAGIGATRVPLDPFRVLGAAAIVGGVLLIFGRSPAA